MFSARIQVVAETKVAQMPGFEGSICKRSYISDASASTFRGYDQESE